MARKGEVHPLLEAALISLNEFIKSNCSSDGRISIDIDAIFKELESPHEHGAHHGRLREWTNGIRVTDIIFALAVERDVTCVITFIELVLLMHPEHAIYYFYSKLIDLMTESMRKKNLFFVKFSLAELNRGNVGLLRRYLHPYVDGCATGPLGVAASTGFIPGVKLLLDNCVTEPFDMARHGLQLVEAAGFHDQVGVLRYLCEECGTKSAFCDPVLTEQTIRFIAEKGQANAIAYLLQILSENDEECYYLSIRVCKTAAENGDIETFRVGMEGMKQCRSFDGRDVVCVITQAVENAIANNKFDFFKFVYDNYGKWNSDLLLNAIYTGNVEIVRVLMGTAPPGFQINEGFCIVSMGWPPNFFVSWAAASGSLPVLKYLVEKNADVTINDNQPLRWARDSNHTHIIEYIETLKQDELPSLDSLQIS